MRLSFLLLLILSLLIIVLSVVTARSLARNKAPTRERKESTRPRDESAVADRSAIWTSPIWNVAGVIAGIVGTIVSAIGLFR